MDSKNRMYAVGWVCAAIIACCLISSTAYYNIIESHNLKDKQIEFAKAGLHEKMEFTGRGSRVIWVKD